MKKNIVITILILLVVGLGSFIVYDKVINKEDKKENNVVEKANQSESEKLVLSNTIFSDIDSDSFISLTIQEDGKTDVAEITDYTVAYEILKELSRQEYTKTITSGIGVGDYEIAISYKSSGQTIKMRMTDSIVFGFDEGYVYTISSSEKLKEELKSFIDYMFLKYNN